MPTFVKPHVTIITPAFKTVKLSCAYVTGNEMTESKCVHSLFSVLHLVFPLGPLLLSGQSGLTHVFQSFTGVHDKCQSHGGGAVAALPWEAQERGPEEGAAAHEGRSHVQRHQDEIEKLWRGTRGRQNYMMTLTNVSCFSVVYTYIDLAKQGHYHVIE